MDNSEDLDLDSLMELLDENEQLEDQSSGSASQSENSPKSSAQSSEAKAKTPSRQISLCDKDLFSSEQSQITENNRRIPSNGQSPNNSTPINDKNTQSNNQGPDISTPSVPQNRKQALKSGFQQNFLNPEKVENPKKDEVYERNGDDKKSEILRTFGELGSSDEEVEPEEKDYLTETGKVVKKELEAKQLPSYHEPKKWNVTTWKSAAKPGVNSSTTKSADSCTVDSFSGIRIVDPLVSFSVLQQRMKDRRMIKMSFIQNFLKGGDIEGDWVTMGVLVSKVPTKQTRNGKPYSIWKMSDLHDIERIVSVFLFRTAHSDHWKTTVGTVVGILNASVMPPGNNKTGELCLAVDHPGKFMLMGKSKDLGFCKSTRKDGTPCNTAVNKFQCEYCAYHVKKEYKKFSATRSEIQTSFNGREPSFKNRILKGANVFYGGQSFTATQKKYTSTIKSKDKLTLSGLGLKRKASEVLDLAEKEKGVKKLAEMYGPKILPAANNNSEFINSQLTKPTVGSRNLLQHLMKEENRKEAEQVVISQKELLRMRDHTARGVLQQRKRASEAAARTPQLGRGLRPGQEFSFEISPSVVGEKMQSIAKMKAIKKIQAQGPLKHKDPNSVKVSEKASAKVKAVLNKSLEKEEKKEKKVEAKPTVSVANSTLGSIDLNSEKVKAILKRGSKHAYEIEMDEMMKEAKYFSSLEKKEQMEEKMAATKEIVCDVVSCLKCKYTADSAAERCKRECHPMKCHKALKRFFECKDCKHRTFGFTRLPKTACRECHGSNFERTSMMKERKGPRLETEVLNVTYDEKYFLNSLTSL